MIRQREPEAALVERRFPPTTLATITALLVTCAGRPASAFDKRTCAASYESAQLYRQQQKLRKAREQLAICAHASCPSVVTLDCTAWLKDVDAAIPTLLFRVRDERGRLVSDFRVLVDGEPVARDVDAPSPLDPGPHLIRIEAETLAPLEQNIVLKAGEHGRLLESMLLLARRDSPDAEPLAGRLREPPRSDARPTEKPSPDKAGAEKTPELALPPEAPAESSAARETGIYLASGVGVLALAGGAYLGLQGTREADQLRATCAPACAKADVDAARTKLVAANVSLGVGIGAVAVAGILWLSGSSAPPKSTGRTRFVGFGVRPSPLGGGGELVATFSAP